MPSALVDVPRVVPVPRAPARTDRLPLAVVAVAVLTVLESLGLLAGERPIVVRRAQFSDSPNALSVIGFSRIVMSSAPIPSRNSTSGMTPRKRRLSMFWLIWRAYQLSLESEGDPIQRRRRIGRLSHPEFGFQTTSRR